MSKLKANGHNKHRGNGSRIDYIVNAREVISLCFVRNESDMENLDSFFPPVYVHQLFQNEKIIGYKELSIRLFFSQPALHCYIEIEYEQKLDHDDTTDIIAEFNKWIKAGFTQNKQEFLKKLKEPFTPIGQLQCQFIKPSNHDSKTRKRGRPRKQQQNLSDDDDDDDDDDNDSEESESSSSGNDGDNDDDNSVKSEEISISPRTQRMRRRKRRLEEQEQEKECIEPIRKKRKLMKNNNNNIKNESDSDHTDNDNNMDYSDAEDQKQDCVQTHIDQQDINNKDNVISKSKFNDQQQPIYEIRVGSFGDKEMREFHERLQFFVLLYIESSSFLDENDEIWEVMTISKKYKGRYQTLGYLTLYKFYAYPDKKRLRISQVMIFPPFQRSGFGFEALQHVYNMAKYRDFIEVNVEDPGVAFTKLRNATDVYNAHLLNVFDSNDFDICNLTTYHNAYINGRKLQKLQKLQQGENRIIIKDELSYSPHTNKNKKKCAKYDHKAIIKDKSLFPFISQHKKLSKDIYHEAIMSAHRLIKITPEQARTAYECLKYEYITKKYNNNKDHDISQKEMKLYRLDVKRRLYVSLNIDEPIHNYDNSGLYARLTQEFNQTKQIYKELLIKRDQMINRYQDWHKTHQYPLWIEKKLKTFNSKYRIIHKKKRKSKRSNRK